jgi:hypothetical protein
LICFDTKNSSLFVRDKLPKIWQIRNHINHAFACANKKPAISFAEEISATTPVVQEISAGNSSIKAILETRGLRQMYELTLKQNRKIR